MWITLIEEKELGSRKEFSEKFLGFTGLSMDDFMSRSLSKQYGKEMLWYYSLFKLVCEESQWMILYCKEGDESE